jgi:formylglycine-generating enzyme required for sulfatase activity
MCSMRVLVLILVLGLGSRAAGAAAPATPETVLIPAGPFIAGSDRAEREHAYQLDERGYGHSVTRQQGWYEAERKRQTIELPAFEIMATLVTNAEYQRFIEATDHPPPDVDQATWEGYGLVHPFARTRRHAWADGASPAGRADHPVVLVDHADAEAYAAWVSAQTGESWRLPSELEWEKAARGTDGRWFSWGMEWDPTKANTHDLGPFDTTPVGSYPDGASPFGMLDPAGNVFEWTADLKVGSTDRVMVKGAGSWDEKGCGVCRPAARHSRPADLKHILIGFRLVRDVE